MFEFIFESIYIDSKIISSFQPSLDWFAQFQMEKGSLGYWNLQLDRVKAVYSKSFPTQFRIELQGLFGLGLQ
jgi:hypothetical protein